MRRPSSILTGSLAALISLLVSPLGSGALRAQQLSDSARDTTTESSSRGSGLDLTIGHWGIGVGNVSRVNGLRLNYRDRGSFVANGINATIWLPHDPSLGVVNGVAIGVPATGARTINGLALGIAGVGADDVIDGVALAPVGVGAGKGLHGIILAGIGGGTGGDITGLALGGVGAGSGGSLRGIGIGGVGAGAGGDVRGLLIGGVGAGSGGSMTGIGIGGIGIGAGGDYKGLAIAGVGAGAGGRFEGIVVAGGGAGSGDLLKGLAIAGIGVGAPRVEGLVISSTAGAEEARGAFIAPAYFRITDSGELTGFSISAFNHIKGEQHGLAIGIFNDARELHGVQIGVLNYAGNNGGGLKMLPVVNVHLP